jgi:hypothetical protein
VHEGTVDQRLHVSHPLELYVQLLAVGPRQLFDPLKARLQVVASAP